MPVLMIFVDGVGIGEFDPETNPFARNPTPFFARFKDGQRAEVPFGGHVFPMDASMGVEGLPQSATGQTALFTGTRAAQELGYHLSGFPTPTLRRLLQEESIFVKIQRKNKTATFANAFTPEYFQRRDRRISATTWAVRASDFPFRMVDDDLLSGQAIAHDLTNEFLASHGYDVPLRSPEQSGEILARIAASVDFCLFEYILTDVIGHKQDMARAVAEIDKLTAFLDTVLEKLDLSRHLVLLTSDHGNFEDLGVSTHTHNLVPTTVWGTGAAEVGARIRRIEEVTPTLLALL